MSANVSRQSSNSKCMQRARTIRQTALLSKITSHRLDTHRLTDYRQLAMRPRVARSLRSTVSNLRWKACHSIPEDRFNPRTDILLSLRTGASPIRCTNSVFHNHKPTRQTRTALITDRQMRMLRVASQMVANHDYHFKSLAIPALSNAQVYESTRLEDDDIFEQRFFSSFQRGGNCSFLHIKIPQCTLRRI